MQFEKHGSNFENTKRKLLEAANLVDKVIFKVKHDKHKMTLNFISPRFSSDCVCDFSCPHPQYYKALSIRVALIGLEVWTSKDMISVSDNPHSTLAAFLSWRGKQLRTLPNDNAQLITSVSHSLSPSNLPVCHSSPSSILVYPPLSSKPPVPQGRSLN